MLFERRLGQQPLTRLRDKNRCQDAGKSQGCSRLVAVLDAQAEEDNDQG